MSAADRSASWSLGLPWWEMPIVPLASQEPGIEIPDPEEVHAMVFKLANCLAIAAPRRTAVQQFPNSLARQHEEFSSSHVLDIPTEEDLSCPGTASDTAPARSASLLDPVIL